MVRLDADQCCRALLAALGNKVVFPGDMAYNQSVGTYWTQQERAMTPKCVASVLETSDVQLAVKTLADGDCQFAVRSGGHSPIGGAANMDGGVTIDMSAMNSVTLSQDKQMLSVGPGARWNDVYSMLDPMNLTVAGGRVTNVGVAGLTLGGGISYVSPRYGFAVDTLISVTVVLASGEVVRANEQNNTDLLYALRGGSNNFGVVTCIDFQVFPQGNVWGGQFLHPLETAPLHIEAISKLTTGSSSASCSSSACAPNPSNSSVSSFDNYDENASVIMAFGFQQGLATAVQNQLIYTDGTENPLSLQPFTSIPQLFNTSRVSTIRDFGKEEEPLQPDGRRGQYATITVSPCVPILTAAFNAWNESLPTADKVPNLTYSLVFQPLPPNIYDRGKPGTDALGLSGRANGPLMVVLVTAAWDTPEHDDTVKTMVSDLLDEVETEARRLNGWDDYKYLNYAAYWQDPIAGYGAESLAQMQDVSRKYDPQGIFQRNVPGGFKLKM